MSDEPTLVIYGDGIHDDTEALQAYVDGTADVVYPDGRNFPQGGSTRLNTETIIITSRDKLNGGIE